MVNAAESDKWELARAKMIRQNKITTLIIFVLLYLLAQTPLSIATNADCARRETSHGLVCVCTESQCDYLENPQPIFDSIAIISSSKAGLRFSLTDARFSSGNKIIISDYYHGRNGRRQQPSKPPKLPEPQTEAAPSSAEFAQAALVIDTDQAFVQLATNGSSRRYFQVRKAPTRNIHLRVNRDVRYQRIIGFGGALTGSVAHILQQLPPSLQDHIYRSYYHRYGIGFTMLRTSIGGSDFDLQPWAYNESPQNDAQLTNFTQLDPRDQLKLQQLTRLKEVAKLVHLKIMATAWSPPPWMKSNGDWSGPSYLKPEYYQSWADYHLRFLELMSAKNMPIWAITTGNEPLNGAIFWLFVHFMSLGWTPKSQAVWLNDNLGPTIRNSAQKNVLIFGNDDQRYSFPTWFNLMKSMRTNVLDYLDGFAVHWYWDEIFAPNLIDKTLRQLPGKILLNTESSIGDKPWETHGPELGSWERGEQYARNFARNLRHLYNGWIDWNLVLDEQGGPNYIKNYVDAAIIVNTTNRVEFYKQPIFYAMGHFSKFIPEGSIRIETQLQNVNLDAVGFERPDRRIVIVLFNGDHVAVDVALNDNVRGNIVINIPARSLHTIVYN